MKLAIQTFILMIFLTVSCAPRSVQQSSTSVTHGKETDKNPQIVLLDTNGNSFCTGTFLSDFVVITAAHCVEDIQTDLRKITIEGIAAIEILTPAPPVLVGVPKLDVALLIFPMGTAEKLGIKSPIALSKTTPKVGDRVQIVGFGNNDVLLSTGSGVKREGYNTLTGITDKELFVISASGPNPTGKDSGIGSGDSGGPLLNTKNEIIGIASWILTISKQPRHASHWARIDGQQIRDFLIAASENLDFKIPNLIPGNENSHVGLDSEIKLLPSPPSKKVFLGVHVVERVRPKLGQHRLLIDHVHPASPAAKGGVAVNDVLLSLNDHQISTLEELQRVLGKCSGTINYEVIRNGKLIRGVVELELPKGLPSVKSRATK